MDKLASAQIGRRALLGVAAGSLAVFLFLAFEVVVHGAWAAVLDPAVTHWLVARRFAAATTFLWLLTQAHSTIGIDALVIGTAAYLGGWRRRWRDAAWFAVAVESSMLLNVVLKNLFARPRPALESPLVHLPTFSFPSGHALAATVFWGCIVCLVPASRRRIALVASAVLVALVALSRVYLGAHYLTDVMAGIAEGLLCVSAWRLARSLKAGDGSPPAPPATPSRTRRPR